MPPVFIYNMPAVNPNNPSQGGPQRTTFRPPWVKEGPTPLPMPTAPWTARGREAAAAAVGEEPNKIEKPVLRKLSKVTIIPSQPSLPADNNSQEQPGKNVIKKVPVKNEKEGPGHSVGNSSREPQRKESTTIPVVVESSKRKESTDKVPVVSESVKSKEQKGKVVPVVIESSKPKESSEKVAPVVLKSSNTQDRRKESVVHVKKEPEKEPLKAAREFAKPTPKPVEKELPKSILKDPSKTSIPSIPKPPPMAPPLPPPLPGKGADLLKSEITPAKAAKLEALRSRPRRRPDWTDMMKEVESGKQLRHVQCNDRSAPVLPKEKAKGQFVYESEKEAPNNPHKQLLTQIQKGIKLKRVKCNDRSKPVLDGLRKFRRQMTIEEHIQKSMSMADVVAVAAEPDELDDIDKVRDDLQSSKQMLALELRSKEALERENKRLMARLLNLEVELEKEKNMKKVDSEKGAAQGRSDADEKLVQKLKEEAAEANRVAKEMEDKYRATAEELDTTRAKLESAWLNNQQLELELKSGSRSNAPITKQPSSKKLAASMASMPNKKTVIVSDDESEYTEETETESEEEEEEENEADAAATQERRIARELKLLSTKLRSYKEKQAIAMKERHSLREQLRKQQRQLRQEKKKYKALQKEVDKMAKLVKDDGDEEDEEDEENPEEEEEEETESESESEESEEDDPTDGDLPEDASVEAKRKNLTDRSKHHESRLGTLKKGNYLLKANIDRIQDDINHQREMSLSLQEDLNSVLAELG